ncbi:hypothetical protein ADAWI_68 [Mycobacterium phage Adawi]|uniref:Uncharacterized protein n=1 Tax=Mycobacterium phage Adawi TaxID=1354507 RepID=T2A7E2_9CAUD|nr:hypothetical protein ADAWI_68 [Mycobacterium phage Adawi]AGU91981.1 hypothetical protein ADAWI_68 [Mycobacterium phage Adawi]
MTHRCRLVERHEITTVADVDSVDYADLYAALFDQARAWHTAHGLEPVDLAQINPRPTTGPLAAVQAVVGVEWTVTVGRGDISEDQRLPGVMDSWKWSARFHHWRKVFNRMDGRQGRLLALREDGRATVTKLFPEATLAPDQRPPWMHRSTEVVGARTGPVDGCTCHLPGPFKDICPVHFDADT